MRFRTEALLRLSCAALLVGGAGAARPARPVPTQAAAPAPAPAQAQGATVRPARPGPSFDLGDGLRGGARAGRLEIWTTARPGEGWQALARRATGRASHEATLRAQAPGPLLRQGQEIVIPRAAWKPGIGARLLAHLFPRDRASEQGWRHVVTDGSTLGFAESPWSLAALFTGDGRRHDRLVVDDDARARGLRPGDVVTVPGDLLLESWREPGARDSARHPTSDPARDPARQHARETERDRARAGPAEVAEVAPRPNDDRGPAAIAEAPVEEVVARQAPQARPAAPGGRSGRGPRVRAEADAPVTDAPAADSAPPGVVLRGSGGLASEGAGSLEIVAPSRNREDQRPDVADANANANANATEDAGDANDTGAARIRRGRPPLHRPADSGGLPEPPDDELARAREPGGPALPADDDFEFTPGVRSADGLLTHALDAEGPHAVYRLQAGETLYSHVVLRFTGLLAARDVNEAARRMAVRSRITDVTAIRVGTPVRIPWNELLPQYLPPGHPRRVAWQQEQSESARLARRETRQNLDGVHVLIDAGHGGNDPGAGTSWVWEDDFVYDIACRVQAILEDRTRATVHPLVKDLSSGHAPLSRIRRDDDEVLLTTPPFLMRRWPARAAVNLRWILSNSIRRKLVGQGVPDDRIVFLSIHADSLHESARGSMVYYASAQYRAPRSGIPADPAYRGIEEASDDSAFAMGRRDMLRAEGLSRALGEAIIGAVRRADLPVHGFTPVRGSIIRSGAWVPAVLKYNRVQSSVLVEACNLNNPADQKNLRDPSFRQSFAEAVVDGLEAYFEDRGPPKADRAAR